jgi:hypothetical protein
MLATAKKNKNTTPKRRLHKNRCLMAHGGDARGDGKCIVTTGLKPDRMEELIFKLKPSSGKNLRKTL